MGIDLLDLYRGKLTVRRVMSFMKEFEPESSVFLKAQMRLQLEISEEEELWGTDRHLLCGVLNRLGQLNYLTEYALWAKSDEKKRGQPPRPPDPIFPPGYQPPKPVMSTPEQLAGFFGAHGATKS